MSFTDGDTICSKAKQSKAKYEGASKAFLSFCQAVNGGFLRVISYLGATRFKQNNTNQIIFSLIQPNHEIQMESFSFLHFSDQSTSLVGKEIVLVDRTTCGISPPRNLLWTQSDATTKVMEGEKHAKTNKKERKRDSYRNDFNRTHRVACVACVRCMHRKFSVIASQVKTIAKHSSNAVSVSDLNPIAFTAKAITKHLTVFPWPKKMGFWFLFRNYCGQYTFVLFPTFVVRLRRNYLKIDISWLTLLWEHPRI